MGSEAPLWSLSAAALGEGYRAGTFTPSDVLASIEDRIEAVNGTLNALVTPMLNTARSAAADSTARFAAGSPLGALDGVPLTVKDNIAVAGVPLTWGSLAFRDRVPPRDEMPVAKLRAAGAVILGKTNVPELTLDGFTGNALFGVTRNPWDTMLTPGGSSGGAVAAVASGMGPLAIGTDGGGSIRRPAAHTGLIGFKPSRGVVDRQNGLPRILYDFEVIGPIARKVRDVFLVMDVIGARCESTRLPDRPLRIAYARQFGTAPVDAEIAAATASMAQGLAALGHEVTPLVPFNLAKPMDAVWPVIAGTGAALMFQREPKLRELASAPISNLAKAGAEFTATDYLNALNDLATLTTDFCALFTAFDLLMTPAIAALSWPAAQSAPTMIDDLPVGPRGHAVFTAFANAVGLPCISLPAGLSSDKLPIGVQLCAGPNADSFLLSVALMMENSGLTAAEWPPEFTP